MWALHPIFLVPCNRVRLPIGFRCSEPCWQSNTRFSPIQKGTLSNSTFKLPIVYCQKKEVHSHRQRLRCAWCSVGAGLEFIIIIFDVIDNWIVQLYCSVYSYILIVCQFLCLSCYWYSTWSPCSKGAHRGSSVKFKRTVQSATINDPFVMETFLFKAFLPLYHSAWQTHVVQVEGFQASPCTVEIARVLGAKSTSGQRYKPHTPGHKSRWT